MMETNAATRSQTEVHNNKPRAAAMYAHLPFCEAKCHYCDFVSYPEKNFDIATKGNIYRSILEELRLHEEQPGSRSSVYLGGGTPSIAPQEFVAALIEQSGALQSSGETTEITLEANPSSVSREKAIGWAQAGINRLSLGIQAWDDTRLEWLGRIHSKMDALDALEAACASGVESISIDYIVGVPGQHIPQIELELGWLLQRFPLIDHVSAYLLTLKSSNRRFHELLDEQSQLKHLRAVRDVLLNQGFEHYEISNFARPGRRSRHNENYWLGGAYLGIGPGAHSYFPLECRRTQNFPGLEEYVAAVASGHPPVVSEEQLTREQARLEYLMLRLRRSEGLDLDEFQTLFGENLLETRALEIDRLQHDGLCSVGKRLVLQADGFFLSDHIFSRLA